MTTFLELIANIEPSDYYKIGEGRVVIYLRQLGTGVPGAVGISRIKIGIYGEALIGLGAVGRISLSLFTFGRGRPTIGGVADIRIQVNATGHNDNVGDCLLTILNNSFGFSGESYSQLSLILSVSGSVHLGVGAQGKITLPLLISRGRCRESVGGDIKIKLITVGEGTNISKSSLLILLTVNSTGTTSGVGKCIILLEETGTVHLGSGALGKIIFPLLRVKGRCRKSIGGSVKVYLIITSSGTNVTLFKESVILSVNSFGFLGDSFGKERITLSLNSYGSPGAVGYINLPSIVTRGRCRKSIGGVANIKISVAGEGTNTTLFKQSLILSLNSFGLSGDSAGRENLGLLVSGVGNNETKGLIQIPLSLLAQTYLRTINVLLKISVEGQGEQKCVGKIFIDLSVLGESSSYGNIGANRFYLYVEALGNLTVLYDLCEDKNRNL
jgi:hypothetical protein